MIAARPLKMITFCIIIRLPIVIYLQSTRLLLSVFFSICSNKCQRAVKSIDRIVSSGFSVFRRKTKNER